MTESYPSQPDRSSPALPELPEPPPERFQFSLKQLLAFMFVSALVATALRQLVLFVQSLTALEQTALLNTTICVLALGGLFYFFFRAPYLAMRAGSIHRRWQKLQEHRRDLESWAQQRRADPPQHGNRANEPPETD